MRNRYDLLSACIDYSADISYNILDNERDAAFLRMRRLFSCINTLATFTLHLMGYVIHFRGNG